MTAPEHAASVESQIDQWRSYLQARQAIHSVDVAELEDHLREQIASLTDAGLADDEAFLVAVKRMGDLDALSREFAREHSERLWKQLVVSPSDSGEQRSAARSDAIVAFSLAVAAAVVIKVPELFGLQLDEDAGFYMRNLSLFVLPLPDRPTSSGSAGSRRARSHGSRWRSPPRRSLRTSIQSPPAAPPRRSRRCTCPWRCGWWSESRTRAAGGASRPGAWTSFDSQASCSSTWS